MGRMTSGRVTTFDLGTAGRLGIAGRLTAGGRGVVMAGRWIVPRFGRDGTMPGRGADGRVKLGYGTVAGRWNEGVTVRTAGCGAGRAPPGRPPKCWATDTSAA